MGKYITSMICITIPIGFEIKLLVFRIKSAIFHMRYNITSTAFKLKSMIKYAFITYRAYIHHDTLQGKQHSCTIDLLACNDVRDTVILQYIFREVSL